MAIIKRDKKVAGEDETEKKTTRQLIAAEKEKLKKMRVELLESTGKLCDKLASATAEVDKELNQAHEAFVRTENGINEQITQEIDGLAEVYAVLSHSIAYCHQSLSSKSLDKILEAKDVPAAQKVLDDITEAHAKSISKASRQAEK